MNKLVLIFMAFLLLSCSLGMLDYEEHIKNGYYYVYVNSEDRTISLLYEKSKGAYIDANVVDYATRFFNKYILILRQPRIDIIREGKQGRGYFLSKKCEYWVIDSETHETIGPLGKEEYIKVEKKIGVPLSDLHECPIKE